MNNRVVRDLFVSAVWAVVIMGAAVGFAYAAKGAMARNEVVECRKWEKQAAEYRDNFYLTANQNEQCRAHGIIINTKVLAK